MLQIRKNFLFFRISELQGQLEEALNELEKLREARHLQVQLVDSIVRQRDMYRILLAQTTGVVIPVQGRLLLVTQIRFHATSIPVPTPPCLLPLLQCLYPTPAPASSLPTSVPVPSCHFPSPLLLTLNHGSGSDLGHGAYAGSTPFLHACVGARATPASCPPLLESKKRASFLYWMGERRDKETHHLGFK